MNIEELEIDLRIAKNTIKYVEKAIEEAKGAESGMDIDPPARKQETEYMSTYSIFSILFMMYSFGVYSGGVYFSNLKDGDYYALTVEKGAGLLVVPTLCFLLTFTLLLARKVRKW